MDNGIMVDGETASSSSTSVPSFQGERITSSFRIICSKVGIVTQTFFRYNFQMVNDKTWSTVVFFSDA